MNDSTTSNKRYSSIANMPDQYPHLGWTEGAYRWLVFNRFDNKFDSCLLKIGPKLIIDLDRFEAWLELHTKTR